MAFFVWNFRAAWTDVCPDWEGALATQRLQCTVIDGGRDEQDDYDDRLLGLEAMLRADPWDRETTLVYADALVSAHGPLGLYLQLCMAKESCLTGEAGRLRLMADEHRERHPDQLLGPLAGLANPRTKITWKRGCSPNREERATHAPSSPTDLENTRLVPQAHHGRSTDGQPTEPLSRPRVASP
jgi:hypothetical protein